MTYAFNTSIANGQHANPGDARLRAVAQQVAYADVQAARRVNAAGGNALAVRPER